MKEKLAEFLSDVVNTKERRFSICSLHILLWILSRFYLGIVAWNSLKRKRDLPSCVISVGNIVLGGTGKTPAVELLARMLKTMGRKVAILSRGYGRRPTKTTDSLGVVSDGKKVLLGAEEGGDEPQLLARNLPGVAVLVGRDRFLVGSYAINNLGTDTLILDDGYQYSVLGRDLDIVTIDTGRPFGNGHVVPRGTLREPRDGLSRADIFLLTRVEPGLSLRALKSELRSINPEAPIIESVHSPICLENIVTAERIELSFLDGRSILALSSIGHPQSFEKTLEGLGAVVKDTLRFADHHRYSSNEVGRILQLAQKETVDAIVTTQKDSMRLEPFRDLVLRSCEGMSGGSINVLALIIELKIIRGREILDRKLRTVLGS